MMKSLALLPILAVLVSAPLGAQTPSGGTTTDTKTDEADGPRRFWQATLPGGNYMVAIDRISSISQHTYMLDGALVVHEVTIDTVGQSLARFYYIEPPTTPSTAANRVIDRGRELIDQAGKRTGNDTANMVTKKYPETTHAKCIEYRLADQAELDALYKSIKDTWETGRGRKFTVK